MRLLITGADGQLGQALRAQFEPNHEVHGVDVQDGPVEDRARMLDVLKGVQPDVVINAAAMTDVDGCEKDPDRAYAVNGLGPRNLAYACRQLDCRLVHISTDFVFNGRAGRPLDEWDLPDPISEYGRSKWVGEQLVTALAPEALICRVAYLFGANPNGFIRKMIQLSDKHASLRVVADQSGNPTWTVDVAAQIATLLDAGETGLFHTVSNGGCSRFELVRFVLRHLGRDTEVLEARSDEFPTPAQRPADSRLRNRMLDLLSLNRMPDWQTAVSRYLGTLETS